MTETQPKASDQDFGFLVFEAPTNLGSISGRRGAMKIETPAGTLAAALSMAELALDDKSNIAALGMVRLAAGGDRVELVVDALDRRVAINVPVSVIESGEACARCISLAGVFAKLRPDQAVRLVRDDDDVVISAGRSRFRIPGLPIDNQPQSAELQHAMAEFSLDAEDVLHLIESTGYAASDEETRYYLNGVYLHTAGTTTAPILRAAANDGNRLAQADLPLLAGVENMPGIIVPNKTIAVVAKLLKRKHVPESITLRISDRQLEREVRENLSSVTAIIQCRREAGSRRSRLCDITADIEGKTAFISSHLRAVASAFQKSGSCKCSDRARSCSPLYPSLCSRSFTFHQRYRYPPFSAASLIAFWTLLIGYKRQLPWAGCVTTITRSRSRARA
jgi:hypothetical protein